MRKFLSGLLIVCCFTAGTDAQQIDIYLRPVQVERSRDYDALHYRVSLTFDLDEKTLRGENLITLTPLADGFTRCILDAEELIVDSVTDSAGRELRFEQSAEQVSIFFSKSYSYSDTITFAVEYHASDPQQGLFFDEKTPDHPRMVSTDSWPDEAHHWIPCYDYPNDKVTHELIITVPEGEKVLSNGRFLGVVHDEQKATTTWHWSQELPHSTYLIMLAIGPFEVIEDSLGSLPVSYWVYPGDVEDARWIFEKTPRMIRFYSDLFQYEYPWAKYDQVTSPRVGGGAEATSATVLGQGVIHDRRAEQDFSWESIIAHEIAHQWWGDLITLREWSHTWLNESFGTYSDYLWTRSEKGEDAGAWDLLGKKNQYLREAHTRYMRPIVFNHYDRPHDNFDSHTYPKGAAVLHMLRFILGDDPFFRTLSYFLHEHEFESVDTHDFQKAIKDVTGQNLKWFFDQYIFKPGHPIFDISYTWVEEEKTVRLKVAQTQDTSKGVPIYEIPVIIGIVTSEGNASQKVWITEQEEFFEFHVDEKPLMVRFDEGNYLLKEWTFPKSVEELLYQFENDDVIGREWAASRLRNYPNDARVETALLRGSRSDRFWAVRLGAVNALGSVPGRKYTEDLKQITEDDNSRVRTAALQILGDYRLPDLVDFFQEHFARDDSYVAQAEALRSIGKSGNQAQLSFLENAATMSSPRDVIKRAAEWAIEELKKNTVPPAEKDRCRTGTSKL